MEGNLLILNPDKSLVEQQLKELIKEWESWESEVEKIVDHDYDHQKQSDVYADGEDNMNKHSVLQQKTITFLDNNVKNHWFIKHKDNNGCDRTNLRLKFRVEHRIQELREIDASLQYANVVSPFWVKILEKSPEMFKKILQKCAMSYLKEKP